MASRLLSDAALRSSLRLPRTPFPMRARAAEREVAAVERITTAVYNRQLRARAGRRPFVLHDGPPYANGTLHMGHLLNKVLKDVANRYHLLRGKRVVFVPGWDCHGLPIEQKALQNIAAARAAAAAHAATSSSSSSPSSPSRTKGSSAKSTSASVAAVAELSQTMDALEIRRVAKATAEAAIADQAKDAQRWGVLADWSRSTTGIYRTLDPAYEARQLEVFARMVEAGCIHRGSKPVFWSPSSRTALAEAELEYSDNHRSQSVFVAFPFASTGRDATDKVRGAPADDTLGRALASLVPAPAGWVQQVAAVAWTTTPWTLPANVALCVHPDLEYVAVRRRRALERAEDVFVVAAARADAFLATVRSADSSPSTSSSSSSLSSSSPSSPSTSSSSEWFVDGAFRVRGLDLAGSLWHHPLSSMEGGSLFARQAPILLAPHVTDDSGTGLVHTAPGHGVEDFEAVQASAPHLPVLCPVDGAGRFLDSVGTRLAGREVLADGNKEVIAMLGEAGTLLARDTITHRYPYDWRTKQPVLIRATPQWFASVGPLHAACRRVLADVVTVPDTARSRLEATLESRTEWCISRQRAWGVPIPVLFDRATGAPNLSRAWLAHVIELVRVHGSNVWWERAVEDLLPSDWRTHPDFANRTWEKGMDTLDVWFDSGTSWASAWASLSPEFRKESENAPSASAVWTDIAPSDMVLEGSDQHRGWFQSSLLTAVASVNCAPYRSIVGHGFVLDGQGRKMSKSLGNVVGPDDVIYGAAVAARKGDIFAHTVSTTTTTTTTNSTPSNVKVAGLEKAAQASAASGSATGFNTPYGVDVARMWAAGSDFTRDVLLSPEIVAKSAESVRKLRNVVRFLLGSLADVDRASLLASCDPGDGASPYTSRTLSAWSCPPSESEEARLPLTPMDRYLLHRLRLFHESMTAAWEGMNTAKAIATLLTFLAHDVSAFYLDVTKDRLYADGVDTPRRRSAQYVLWQLLRGITLASAPVAAFTAEDAFQHSAAFLDSSWSHALLSDAALAEDSKARGGSGKETGKNKGKTKTKDKSGKTSSGGSTEAGSTSLTTSTTTLTTGTSADAPEDLLAVPAAGADATVFDVEWTDQLVPARWRGSAALEARWESLLQTRESVHRALENAREAKAIGSDLDAHVTLVVVRRGPLASALHELRAAGELEDLFKASSVTVLDVPADALDAWLKRAGHAPSAASAQSASIAGVGELRLSAAAEHLEEGPRAPEAAWFTRRDVVRGAESPADVSVADADASVAETIVVQVGRAPGEKCERCWKWSPSAAEARASATFLDEHGRGRAVCARCAAVLRE